jgi:hypothetical protein
MANNISLAVDQFDWVFMRWKRNKEYGLRAFVYLHFPVSSLHIPHMDWVACVMGIGIGVIAVIGRVVHVFILHISSTILWK